MRLKIGETNPDPYIIKKAAKIIRAGGLVIFPTETVYGLAADALNEKAVARIFEVKGRPAANPLPIQIASVKDINVLTSNIPDIAKRLMNDFFPGPLTLVFESSESISELITAGTGKVGIRMPDHRVALALIKEFGGPIIATSANLTGQPAPTTADEAVSYLGKSADAVLDCGPTKIMVPSTVVDVSADPPVILREGSITKEALKPYFI